MAHGGGIRAVELQGVLSPATTEPVIRDILALRDGLRHLIVDFQHTTGINGPAATVLVDLASHLRDDGLHVLFTNTAGVPMLTHILNDRLHAATAAEILR